jgi:hypothetical protein
MYIRKSKKNSVYFVEQTGVLCADDYTESDPSQILLVANRNYKHLMIISTMNNNTFIISSSGRSRNNVVTVAVEITVLTLLFSFLE